MRVEEAKAGEFCLLAACLLTTLVRARLADLTPPSSAPQRLRYSTRAPPTPPR